MSYERTSPVGDASDARKSEGMKRACFQSEPTWPLGQ